MKKILLLVSLFTLVTTQAQTQDTLYVWKVGVLVNIQSIKPADMDSITFKRPLVNLLQVPICDQVWATKNLVVTTYSDGTPIPQVTNQANWENLTTGAWCYYNNDPVTGEVYGKLYNWYAVAGIYDAASLANPSLRKKLAPTGWHVPTDPEWTQLTNCLGGSWIAGGKMKETGTAHWNSPNTAATNSSGFTGLPGGSREGSFNGIGSGALWWGSSSENTTFTHGQRLELNSGYIGRVLVSKKNGFSVRCIRD